MTFPASRADEEVVAGRRSRQISNVQKSLTLMRSRRMEDGGVFSTPGIAGSPSDVFDGADDDAEYRAVRKYQHVCKI